jgi:hypothetical protein
VANRAGQGLIKDHEKPPSHERKAKEPREESRLHRPDPRAHLWEHLFVGSHTCDFTRFRQALDAGNVAEALMAASALHHVGLVEALEL